MHRKLFIHLLTILAVLVLSLGAATGVQAADAPPNYRLQYLGAGTPGAINNNGLVVGTKLNASNNREPLFSVGGGSWQALPVPAGGVNVFPTDVNDNGVIVGVSYSASQVPSAVRWLPSGNGYTVEVLPRLAGDTVSYATGINNLGQIVGARNALGYVPTGSGWMYSDAQGLVALSQYGLWVVPNAINDNGIIIAGQERLNLNTGVTDVIGNGPTNYNAVGAVAINNSGMMVGSASLRSSSLNIVSVFRYEAATGWTFVAGSSKYTVAASINSQGDIGYGEQGPGLYLSGLGTYALGNLLDPSFVSAGWAVTGSYPYINDSRVIAVTGRNSVTGESGGILLTPTGTLQPPTAPANLQGVSHPATSSEPFNSINLTWQNTSTATQSYDLERRETGGTTWTRLSLTPPGTATNHTDTTVGVGITYEYRIRAVGLGGPSAWSNSAIVTSPATPQDTTPPVASITTPANGASVTGIVTLSATATDNVAVEYLEISYWNQYIGQQVIIGSVSKAGALTVNWDTRSLTPAAYSLRAYAYDALGNWTQTDITVNVGAAPKAMKVTSITLSGIVSGTRANITGYVYVKDGNGRAISNATVAIRWTIPGGTTKTMSATTNYLGRAGFTVSGGRGTYTLTVTNVTKSGYTFDTAGSIITKSITK